MNNYHFGIQTTENDKMSSNLSSFSINYLSESALHTVNFDLSSKLKTPTYCIKKSGEVDCFIIFQQKRDSGGQSLTIFERLSFLFAPLFEDFNYKFSLKFHFNLQYSTIEALIKI